MSERLKAKDRVNTSLGVKRSLWVILLFSFLLLSGVGESPVYAQGVIRIGAVQPLTGPVAVQAESVNMGLEDSLKLANEEGGINGKKIEYVMEDGHFNPEKVGKKAFERIMNEAKPLIMFTEGTALTLAVAEEIKDRYKILVTSSSFSSKMAYTSANKYVFVCGPTFGDQMAVLLKYIATQNRTAKVAFLYTDTELGKDPMPYAKLMCEKLRLDLVACEITDFKAENIGKQIQEIKAKNPDYVILHGYIGRPVPKIIKQCREIGIKSIFAGGSLWETGTEMLGGLGPLAEGYVGVNPYSAWWMTDVPGIRKMRACIEKYHGGVTPKETNTYTHGFVTGMVFAEVLRRADKAGKLDGDGLVAALQSLDGFDMGGICAPLKFKNNRFPAARVWKANPEKKIFEPVSEWIAYY